MLRPQTTYFKLGLKNSFVVTDFTCPFLIESLNFQFEEAKQLIYRASFSLSFIVDSLGIYEGILTCFVS
jgi:hypothetical protein